MYTEFYLSINSMPDSLSSQLSQFAKRQSATFHWWVGLSGGVDSVALLHLLASIRSEFPEVTLKAIHVNHGLQAEADDWAVECEQLCLAFNVELISKKIQVETSTRKGVERLAREARWKVFDEVVEPGGALWLAHHKDDQVETLLLNLLRGCGVQGAGAMRACRQRAHYQVLRPMLNIAKQSLIEYAKQQGLDWVDDPSNQQLDLRRNFLRQQILPQVESQWPGCREPLLRFTEIMQQSSELLNEIAEQDLLSVEDDMRHSLNIEALATLSKSRISNLLMHWLSTQCVYAPPQARLDEFVRQLMLSRSSSNTELLLGDYCLKQSSKRLHLVPVEALKPVSFSLPWQDLSKPLLIEPLNKTVHCRKNANRGVRLPTQSEKVTVRSRQGGEHCWPHYRNRSSSLKKIFNELEVPEWQRDKVPLIFYNETLVCAAGYFYDKNHFAQPGFAVEYLLNDLSLTTPDSD